MDPRHPPVHDRADDEVLETRVALEAPVAERAFRKYFQIGGRQTLAAVRAAQNAVRGTAVFRIVADVIHNY